MENEITIKNNSNQLQNLNITNEMMNSFINYTDVSKITLRGYKTCLKHFFCYLQAMNISQPNRQTILSYKEFLTNPDIKTAERIAELQNQLSFSTKRIRPKSEFSTGTQRQYLRAVKQFFEWTETENIYPNASKNIKTASVKQDNSRRDAFSGEDIKMILDAIDITTEQGARDYAIILLCVLCALRIIEVQRANIDDIETIKGRNRIYIQGKGHTSKDDYKDVAPELMDVIEHYLTFRTDLSSKQPLFSGLSTSKNKGGRLTEPSLSRIIKTRIKNAGFDSKRLTAHSLRHASVTIVYEETGDKYKAQQHARHIDSKTTEIYMHSNEKEKARFSEIVYHHIFNDVLEPQTKQNTINLEGLSDEQIAQIQAIIKGKEGHHE